MKKIISTTLLLVFSIFTLSACGGSDFSSDVQPEDATPPSTNDPVDQDDVSTIKVVYNRIDWRDYMEDTSLIKSVEELQEYYENLKAVNYNDLDEELVWRLTGDQYNNAFFENNFLVLVTLAEGSGSISHEVTAITEDNGVITINLDRNLPGFGTADMAGWLITIELSNDYSAESAEVVMTNVPF